VGARLRTVRQGQGLSLSAVQQRSGGWLNRAVLGSYERANRSVSLRTLAGIAACYGVPLAQLLPESRMPMPAGGYHRQRVTLDLAALGDGADMPLLHRYARMIQVWREDYNATVLSLRATDVAMLAIMHGSTPAGLVERLAAWGVLATDPALCG
jgi:transcriptional regulator with XRE-family HTH domain